jgi:asparagine synthase (glutamine-hydrolysing)
MDTSHKNGLFEPDLSVENFAWYDHLGSDYPYFCKRDPGKLYADMASAATAIPVHQRKIDAAGIVEMLSRGFMFGRRTLLSDLKKAPWRGRPNGCGGWHYADLPKHDNQILPLVDVARSLQVALEKEALKYLDGRRRIGILLSGGMDSRIVAGILRTLQLRGDFTGEVIGLTWGVAGCRDVTYAAEVTKRFGWEQMHFELNPEQLLENIHVAGEMGAEFAPYHLHALPKIAGLEGLEAIFAGSYGDSVGRAEYSGTRVRFLRPMLPKDLNKYGLVRERVMQTSRSSVYNDAYGYRKNITRELEFQYREIEYQMHYLRRRIQDVFRGVGRRIPFFQMFTAPDVFSLVWRLDPLIRDDRIYRELVAGMPGKIGEIPWARTGKVLGAGSGLGDHLPKEHHRYGHWLRNDLREEILALVDNDSIRGLGVINEATLDRLLKLWPMAKTLTSNHLDENISWLASLSVFIKKYQVSPLENGDLELSDRWNTVSGLLKAWTYRVIREKFRT